MTIGLPLFCDVKESRPDVPVFCSSIVGIAGIMASVLLVINIRPFCPHRRRFRSFLADSLDKGVEQPIAGDTAAQRFLLKKTTDTCLPNPRFREPTHNFPSLVKNTVGVRHKHLESAIREISIDDARGRMIFSLPNPL